MDEHAEKIPVTRIGPSITYFEHALAQAEQKDDPEKALMVQLTDFELALVSFGLFWVERVYGDHATRRLRKKLIELVDAQEFCDCPRCRAERGEADE